MVRKRWNTVRWKELLGSPGRMPHLAREQRLATLDGHCLCFRNPNEGKYAVPHVSSYPDAATFEERGKTYAVKKQSAEKKKKVPFAPTSEAIMYGKTNVRIN
jgi:hypothetical protein